MQVHNVQTKQNHYLHDRIPPTIFCHTQICHMHRITPSSLKSFGLINLFSMKCEKNPFIREATRPSARFRRFGGI